MASGGATEKQRVVVVTGGAVGIGAAIAEALGRRGAYVVTVDPVVAVDGTPAASAPEQTTAERIVGAGGAARASSTSVTDRDALAALFSELVDEFGALDAVVNVAGISRPSGFASGTEEDWTRVLSVHLDGYLNVLGCALPLMTAAGHGRILGVTSGSGWRAADAGAYSCAKRAVSSLTWQVGRVTPEGVTVNALSPIAATRMVANALARQGGGGDRSGRSAASGGVALGAAPPPERLGPVGAYLASDDFAWCRGEVVFSNGSEVSLVAPPGLLEVVRTTDVASLARVLDTVVPAAFVPAEVGQVSTGGSVPRFGDVFADSGAVAPTDPPPRVAIVTDDQTGGAALADALAARGARCVGIGAWQGAQRGPTDLAPGFDGPSGQLADVIRDHGPLDAVVVAVRGPSPSGASVGEAWQRVLDEHAGITDAIRQDASWARAVADAATERPMRIVTLTDATTAGGRSRAMAAAQLARAAHTATGDRVDAFSLAVESDTASARHGAVEFAAVLACGNDVSALSGAELVATADWVGLRSHPRVAGTVAFGGPDVPGWVDAALRRIVGAHEPWAQA